MSISTRQLCLTLSLLIALSQVALAVHASGHSGPDQITCQLCIGQSQQTHAITPSILQFAPIITTPPRHSQQHVSANLPLLQLAYSQRAPPFLA
ncbi:MAG: hypothetical protein HN764_05490 [Gammaproteobacteria bacterium]|jgi:hypothetical protein|nr:hypothetical protein [Gammaproteobacteria bacterium]